MNDPLFNVVTRIDTIVGRQLKVPDAMNLARNRNADSIGWHQSLAGLRVLRGVHRFRVHEEANKQSWQMTTRPTA